MQRAPGCASVAPMIGLSLILSDQTLHALPSGALYWPARRVLTASDLHLGKSTRMARRGGSLLPPFETLDTLTRLEADIGATGAETVICLGDSFDDDLSCAELDDTHRQWLLRLMAGRAWVWIAGNHDPAPLSLGGSTRTDLTLHPLSFCHIATPDAVAEVSGHFHPKARLAGRSRACFVADDRRVILPAYGTYTGGLAITDPALTALFSRRARALLTGPTPLVIPVPGDRP